MVRSMESRGLLLGSVASLASHHFYYYYCDYYCYITIITIISNNIVTTIIPPLKWHTSMHLRGEALGIKLPTRRGQTLNNYILILTSD